MYKDTDLASLKKLVMSRCLDGLSVILTLTRYSLCNRNKQKNIIKGELSDSFTNYNNVGNTKVSVSIKKTYANKCTLSESFLTEILKSFSGF